MEKVRNILQAKGSNIFSVSPDTTVYDALDLMCDKNVGALLVVENNRLRGIFTERDYARKVILRGKASRETLIEEIMTEHPTTVTPDSTIEDCMKLMTNKFIRHLPVIDRNELVGLVSIGDVVRYIIDEQKYIIENLEQYITGHHE
jgi:CBS domain-containing protein